MARLFCFSEMSAARLTAPVSLCFIEPLELVEKTFRYDVVHLVYACSTNC